MRQQDRAVTPVISTILMVALVVILAAIASVAVLDVAENLNEPAPVVGDTTGEFVVDDPDARDNQIVRITHIAGEDVAVGEVEIVVRATGPSLDTTARLVDLPTENTALSSENIEGDTGLIQKGVAVQTIQEDDPNVWSAGRTIEFRVNTGAADFREDDVRPPSGGGPEADKLDVTIVHTPSGSIISRSVFTP